MRILSEKLPGFQIEDYGSFFDVYAGNHHLAGDEKVANVMVESLGVTRLDLAAVASEVLEPLVPEGTSPHFQIVRVDGLQALLCEWIKGSRKMATWFVRDGLEVVLVESEVDPEVYASPLIMGKRVMQAIQWGDNA